MEWLLLLLVVPVIFFALQIFIGFFFQKSSGKHLLRKELQKYGISTDTFPDEFFTEAIEQCDFTADAMYKIHGCEGKSTYFVQAIEGEAYNIANALRASQSGNPLAANIDTAARLKKYDLI